MRIAAVQHDIVWEDREANFERLAPQVAAGGRRRRRAGAAHRDVLHRLLDDPGRSASRRADRRAQFLADQAAEHGVWVAGTCPEIAAGGDAALQLLRPGRARRHHAPLPQAAPVHLRRRARALPRRRGAGDRAGRRACGSRRSSATTCASPTCSGGPRRRPTSTSCRRTGRARAGTHWQTLLQARAIENQAYVVGCNRVGTAGDGTEHVGDSRIVDPMGELLATAAGGETIVLADVDPAEVAATRDRFRFLPDRRGPAGRRS